jgi:hypothetical protein
VFMCVGVINAALRGCCCHNDAATVGKCCSMHRRGVAGDGVLHYYFLGQGFRNVPRFQYVVRDCSQGGVFQKIRPTGCPSGGCNMQAQAVSSLLAVACPVDTSQGATC